MRKDYLKKPGHFDSDPHSYEGIQKYEAFKNVPKNYWRFFLTDINDLKAEFKDQPCYIIGAGPSLDANLPYFKEHYSFDKATSLACDSAMGTCVHEGIYPTAFVSVEHERTDEVITDDIREQFRGARLLCPTWANPKLVDQFIGQVYFYNEDSPFWKAFLDHRDRFLPELPYVETRGINCGFACVSLARYLGASEVILLGFDGEYVNGKHHTKHLAFDIEQKEEDLLFHFEQFVNVCDGDFKIKTTNCSGQGILTPDNINVTCMSLQEKMEEL